MTKAILTVSPQPQTKVYGAELPPLTAIYDGFVNGDTAAGVNPPILLSTIATAQSPVGTYPISASAGSNPNYTVIVNNSTLTVTPAPLVIVADDKSMSYGSSLPDFTATYRGFVNGDTASALTQPVSFTTPATSKSGVGTYPIILGGGASPNYSLSLSNGVLTITKAALALTIIPDNQVKVYGAALPPLTATFSGAVDGETAAG